MLNTKGQYMKESNILVNNANIKQHQKEIMLNTKGQYMKKSNFLVSNAAIKQQQEKVLLNTKGWNINESNIPVKLSRNIKGASCSTHKCSA